jgi:phosphatidylinositol alpha-1,6-mannosyltransferase
MERLNWHAAAELAKVAEVRVIGPTGSAAVSPDGVTTHEAPLRPLWQFLWRGRALARREAGAWKPDIVLAGSGLTAPLALAATRLCRARTAVYVHGLDVAVKHPVYRAIWLRAIRRIDRVIANSHATAALCRSAGVDPERIGIVYPGVDLPAEPSADAARPAFLEGKRGVHEEPFCGGRHGGHGPVLLAVGRLSARKGLREFVEQAFARILAVYPDALLRIVGAEPKDALHAQAQTPASIRAAAARAGVAGHLDFLGTITDYARLGAIYRAADVHVFPVREIPGDPEGFGMVAVEAAAHGLATVAFATGGVVDAVAEGQSGHLVPPGDYAAFANAIVQILADRNALRGDCIAFAQGFAWPEFGAALAAQLGIGASRGTPNCVCPR